MGISLRIQAVLYNNARESIKHSFCSIVAAARDALSVCPSDSSSSFVVVYGDASENALLDKENVGELADAGKGIIDFEYIHFGENTGFGRGHNRLSRVEDKLDSFLLIINPDVVLAPDAIRHLLEPFFADPGNVGITEARQSPIEHPKFYNRDTGETSWASGACMMTPLLLFQQLNGFDEKTFYMYCEDVDYSWRVRLKGKEVIYRPSAIAYHPKRLSADGRWHPTDTEIRCSYESALFMAYKWSADNVLNQLLEEYANGNEWQVKARSTYFERLSSGDLPPRLDPDHKIATFVKGNYTEHRFAL